MNAAVKPRVYSEPTMIRALARGPFEGYLCCVDRCNALGSECDLLAVHKNLRCVDVEVKISRADLKADRKKDKWFLYTGGRYEDAGNGRQRWVRNTTPLDWPRGVWKHYYAVAADIWKPELLDDIRPGSGVLVVTLGPTGRAMRMDCVRRAKADASAKPISTSLLANIARLTSLRLWDRDASDWRGGQL